MIMVDTSVWIDYFNGIVTRETNLFHQSLSIQPIATGDLILTEVLQGFRNDQDFDRAKQFFSTLTFFEMGGWDNALKSAENYRYLRKRGLTVRKTIDVVIGTFCIEKGIPLLHSDKDFDLLEKHLGLQVV
jgi:predicted nucleic acid-binding protein